MAEALGAKKLWSLRGEQEEEPRCVGRRRAATRKLTRRSTGLVLGGVRFGLRRGIA